jgi:hypothetical protein
MKHYFLLFLSLFLNLNLFSASIKVSLENDCLLPFNPDDSDYSHGTEIRYIADKPLWIFDNIGFSVNQNMYTPDNIDIKEIQPNDRPYCGLLLGNFITQNYFDLPVGYTVIEQKFGIGTIGKYSFAEETQKLVHDIKNARDPRGWDNQLSDELILQYQIGVNLNIPFYENPFFTILSIPYAELDIGNFKTQFKYGYDFRFCFVPTNKTEDNFIFSDKQKPPFNVFFIAGIERRHVMYDASIDGNYFNDCIHHLDSNSDVVEFHYGIHIDINNFEIEYIVAHRTKEYKGQDDPPDFAKLSIKYNF